MEQQVFSITQVNEYIRSKMEQDYMLCHIAVRGEISNYKMYPSGHHYFTLKDENSALRCVLFRGNAVRLRFRPENGIKIIAIGKITVYPRDGAYQLICEMLTVDGVGDLHAAFEQLKAKLSAQGLFNPGHKKPLPKYPQTVGIVTSSAGAAVHDMIRILRKRYPLVSVKLIPVRVQGVEAPGEISAAIRFANRFQLADLLIVGRGGGSIEDLWAFNDEQVAYAIYESEIPVISAVGHEPDVTISDYVADLRAATPSNAAELAVPDMTALMQTLDSDSARIGISLKKKVAASRQKLMALAGSPAIKSPAAYLSLKEKNLHLLKSRLIAVQKQGIAVRTQRFVGVASKLDAMSPLKVLTRGYTIAESADGKIMKSAYEAEIGKEVSVRFSDGIVFAEVKEIAGGKNEQ